MLKRLLYDPVFIILVLVAAVIKLASLNSVWVEQKYSSGIFQPLGAALRALLRHIPFSVGDVLYAAAGIYLIYLLYTGIEAVRLKGFLDVLPAGIIKAIKIALLVYVWFNLLWGLNYNRLGIAHQLELEVQPYTLEDVTALTQNLQQQLNLYAAKVDSSQKWNSNASLLAATVGTYKNAAHHYPYLKYRQPTIKPSLYTHVGHYFGFTGYYNPFTGEAQLKTTIPAFIKPFVALHEAAHQLGYAKENEANFIAFLAGKHSGDEGVLYSVYYELYRYALREVAYRDTAVAATFKATLHPRVVRDNEILKAYLLTTQNKIEPLMTFFYDTFLKVNNQAEGIQTYNRVVALLVAYRKKMGANLI